ncbi:phage baseplate assembly protein V [Dictyobacter formicarum]|uniref:Phage tail protein n=1 Tax=Dictyobacter formicarum TaxID=2778368 RepID=A0ABQ3VPM6_9CHLR|nr:phage baseplate assembly protein V [Dictyobacter formicarum]GHO87624.1 phage tail protein [Dictyobacter formicarum]
MNLDSSNLERAAVGPGGLFYGVYPALVLDIMDPETQGRVKVGLPWAPDGKGSRYEAWARLATLMAGNNRGTWFVPEVNDEVLVAFEGGNPRRPYIIGSLWNGADVPPERMDSAGDNNIKTILSRQGVRITLDDTVGAVKLRLETPNGQSIILNDTDNSLLAEDSNGNSIRLDAGGITVIATSEISLSASTAKIEAGLVTVSAGMSQFSGVVQCDTLITNAVVSSSYTPGAGNIW